MNTASVLGANAVVLGVTIKGKVSVADCRNLTVELIDRIGMSMAGPPTVCNYPADGKGGVGFTLFQPITESFITWDAWPDLGGVYLHICSCKAFSIQDALDFIKESGHIVLEYKAFTLSLGRKS